jgi:hypothetical protein
MRGLRAPRFRIGGVPPFSVSNLRRENPIHHPEKLLFLTIVLLRTPVEFYGAASPTKLGKTVQRIRDRD